jgi:chemotaxis protein methyltransferase CheR
VTAALESSAPDVERFRSAVRRRLGLDFDDGRLGFLSEVLQRRIAETGRRPAHYLADLEAGATGGDDLRAVARELTVGETYFFRNAEQFHALGEIVLPERARAQEVSRRLQILSAGCASGEEPYTLAIVVREHAALAGFEVSIRAADVNPEVLLRAAAGRYSTWALRETPDDLRDRYFRRDGREYVLDPDLRSAVTFEERNLAELGTGLWRPQAFDVVFCRNILMYFAPEVARAVVDRIAGSLVPGGYLFLGSAETLRGVSQDFHLCQTHGTFYYRRREGIARPLAFEAPPVARPARGIAEGDDSWVETIGRASERIRLLTKGPRLLTAAAPDGANEAEDFVPEAAAQLGKQRAASDLGQVVELIRQERFVDAQSALALVPPELAREPEVLLLRSVLLTHGGDLVAAEKLCAEVLANDEQSAGAHYLTALCRERSGDTSGAADHDRAAVSSDPGFAMPHLHLGLLARRAGDLAAARRELSRALALLDREDPLRLTMFGGGFGREGLISLCRAELLVCGGST